MVRERSNIVRSKMGVEGGHQSGLPIRPKTQFKPYIHLKFSGEKFKLSYTNKYKPNTEYKIPV